MFFGGIAKFIKARPGHLDQFEKTISVMTPLIIIFFPVYWMRLYPGLLAVNVLPLTVFGVTIRRNEYKRCIYFERPANSTAGDTKNQSL